MAHSSGTLARPLRERRLIGRNRVVNASCSVLPFAQCFERVAETVLEFGPAQRRAIAIYRRERLTQDRDPFFKMDGPTLVFAKVRKRVSR